MNFLDYLVNAMTGGQPTQQELMARQMAKQGLLGDPNSVVRESEMPNYSTGNVLRESELYNNTGRNVLRESEMKKYDPNSVLRESEMRMMQQPAQMSPYMQNLINPGMTMQQNYVDPRLIEQMYYRGLLSR
jgi:hypothetical protein